MAKNDCGETTLGPVWRFTTLPEPSGEVIYSFNSGWNLITLSRQPDFPYTAATLTEAINNQGGSITKVQRWDGSGWKTYQVGAPFGNFDIEVGQGYFLLADDAGQWSASGDSPVCVTYTFANGWNLFGFPIGGPYTAGSLSQAINNSGGGITKVQRWDGSGWRTYQVGAPFGNFDVDSKEGIFLLASSPSNFDVCQFKVSNVRDTQFTISWTSEADEEGLVNYGETTSLGQTEYDDRGQVFSKTHHVTITGLSSNTTYYYEVVAGSTTFDNSGNHFSITTGPSIIPAGSVLPAGQVFESDGATPAEGAIVYITIKDIDGQGSDGSSALTSVLVDNSGYWYMELVNIRDAGYQNLFNFTEDVDHIVINVDGGAGKKAQLETEATDYNGGGSPRPDIVLP